MYRFSGATPLLLVAVVVAGACQQNKTASPDQSSDASGKQYEIVGKVVAVGDDRQSVTLDHQDIPGLMVGMEMKFQVNDPQMLADIQSGDQVQGRLKVESGDYIITHLEKRQPPGELSREP